RRSIIKSTYVFMCSVYDTEAGLRRRKMIVKVRVSKLTDTSNGQYKGGTYFLEESIAKELVAGGHAVIVKTESDPVETPKEEVPFLPTKTSKSDTAKAPVKRKATKKEID